MALAQFVFTETSPGAPGTSASSAAVAGSANYAPSGIAVPFDDYESLNIVAELVGATGGTLDVYLQISPNQGVNWFDFAHFPQLAGGAAAIKYTLTASLYSPLTVPVVIGKDLSPVLAANTFVNGAMGDRLRLLMVAGGGTSVGAAVKVYAVAQRTFPRP